MLAFGEEPRRVPQCCSRFDADGDGQAEAVFYNGFRAGVEIHPGTTDPQAHEDWARYPDPDANALGVAKFLQADPRVAWVNYPGLPDHPQHALMQRQMRGASGLLSFGVKGGLAQGVTFIESAQFMSHLVNIGDTRTLISHPASTTHRQLDEAQQLAAGVPPDMVRISVGLENLDDILWDIDQALDKASR